MNNENKEKIIEWGRLGISSTKLDIGTFHAGWAQKKDRNGMDLTEAEEIKKRRP